MRLDLDNHWSEQNVTWRSKEEGKDQESIQSGNTPNSGHHMGKPYDIWLKYTCSGVGA